MHTGIILSSDTLICLLWQFHFFYVHNQFCEQMSQLVSNAFCAFVFLTCLIVCQWQKLLSSSELERVGIAPTQQNKPCHRHSNWQHAIKPSSWQVMKINAASDKLQLLNNKKNVCCILTSLCLFILFFKNDVRDERWWFLMICCALCPVSFICSTLWH